MPVIYLFPEDDNLREFLQDIPDARFEKNYTGYKLNPYIFAQPLNRQDKT